MPGTAAYTIRVYNIHSGGKQTMGPLTEESATGAWAVGEYKDITITDDAEYETAPDGVQYAPQLNDSDHNGGQNDIGETPQKLGETVRLPNGKTVNSGANVAAGQRYTLNIYDENDNIIDTGYIYLLSAGGQILGWASTIPLEEGMIYGVNNPSTPYVGWDESASYEELAPCFTAGTLIETADGGRLIETLKVGDLVKTADNGLKAIRWIGLRKIGREALSTAPNLQPIRIREGALGKNTPTADLIVSPQHRILVRSKIAQRMFGVDEVLVAAKQLLGVNGIEIDRSFDAVTYVHFMCATHEVVFAEGAPTESLYLGPEARRMLGEETLEEIFGLFPDLRDYAADPRPVRALVKGRRAKQLAFRHRKNSQALIAA